MGYTMPELSKDGKSLLLFLETRAVDYGGRVDARHMNSDDFVIAKIWSDGRFIEFGRIYSKDVTSQGAHWVRLSDEAFVLAHQLRKERAERMWGNRVYETTRRGCP